MHQCSAAHRRNAALPQRRDVVWCLVVHQEGHHNITTDIHLPQLLHIKFLKHDTLLHSNII